MSFETADLANANLNGLTFRRTNFFAANLKGATLVNSTLTQSNLEDVNLVGADLTGANLAGSNMTDANLSKAILVDTNFEGAIFCQTIMPEGTEDNTGCDLRRRFYQEVEMFPMMRGRLVVPILVNNISAPSQSAAANTKIETAIGTSDPYTELSRTRWDSATSF